MAQLETIYRSEVKSFASIVHSTTWKFDTRGWEYKIKDWKEEYTVYPPYFNLSMSSGPSFNTREDAEKYIESRGWRALPSRYILKEDEPKSIIPDIYYRAAALDNSPFYPKQIT